MSDSPNDEHVSTLRAAFAVAAKELWEGFRDRQTLLYTFVLPVCMYPALFWVMVQGVLVVQGQKGARNVDVAIVAPADDADAVRAAVEVIPETGGGRVDVTLLPPDQAIDADTLTALIDGEGEDAPDAVLVIPSDRSDDDPARIYHDSTSSRSSIARERVAQSLRTWSSELRNEEAETRSLDPKVLDPILIESEAVNEDKDKGALVLSLMLPMLLIVMCVLGAFFPAVDLTAGEKERNTQETTMLLPVPRVGLHLGKIFAVCATSMIATTLNLLALGLSAGHLLSQLASLDGDAPTVELPIGAFMAIAPLAILFAFFVSATLTGVASLASSFKEGQALLGPVQMVFILPAMAASLPGLTLDYTTAWIPVVNVALAFRGMLVGNVGIAPLAMCAVALLICALAAIAFSVRLRSNEQVALSGETLSLGKIFGLLRAPRAQR